jgi:bifunctional DNA-binding transcriptional regulator/antitoxin component of YhaV-PrlF toxin-antitoxin module
MEITKISNEGQVIIPEALRKFHGWEVEKELIAFYLYTVAVV